MSSVGDAVRYQARATESVGTPQPRRGVPRAERYVRRRRPRGSFPVSRGKWPWKPEDATAPSQIQAGPGESRSHVTSPGQSQRTRGGRDITGTAPLSCRCPVDSRGPALRTTPTSAGGHDEQISRPRLTPTSHTVTKANGSRRPRPCDGVQSSAKVDVSSSGSNEESKEKVFSPPTRNKTFPGSVANCMRLCVRESLHAKGGRSSSLARASVDVGGSLVVTTNC